MIYCYKFFQYVAITALIASVYIQVGFADQSRSIKIGCIYPLTGPGGLYGRDSIVAIKMAQDYLQTLEPTIYTQLEIMIDDSRSKSLRSLQIARKFVNEDKVDFLCGVVNSGIALNISQLAKESEVFFIGTDHASPSLTAESRHPYYFRMNNGTRLSMLAGSKYIVENFSDRLEPLKIAFIGPDYDYGYQAWDDLKGFLTSADFKIDIVGEFWPKLFATDYTTYIRQLKKSKADIVVNGHWGLDLVTFVRQANQMGLFERSQFMNFDAGGNYEVFAELRKDMPLGLVLSARHHVNWPETKNNEDFVVQFHDRAGRYPSYAAQGAYTGILAIAKALRIAGGVEDKDKLRKAFENLSLSLPEDPDGFQSHIDPESHQMLQVQAIGKTELNNTYPPATVQLGQWSVYYPPKTWPTTTKAQSE